MAPPQPPPPDMGNHVQDTVFQSVVPKNSVCVCVGGVCWRMEDQPTLLANTQFSWGFLETYYQPVEEGAWSVKRRFYILEAEATLAPQSLCLQTGSPSSSSQCCCHSDPSNANMLLSLGCLEFFNGPISFCQLQPRVLTNQNHYKFLIRRAMCSGFCYGKRPRTADTQIVLLDLPIRYINISKMVIPLEKNPTENKPKKGAQKRIHVITEH